MTPVKSLQIINEAIEKSRRDFEQNAGTTMILWGAVVMAFSLAVCIKKQLHNHRWLHYRYRMHNCIVFYIN